MKFPLIRYDATKQVDQNLIYIVENKHNTSRPGNHLPKNIAGRLVETGDLTGITERVIIPPFCSGGYTPVSKGIQADGKCKDCGSRFKWDAENKYYHCPNHFNRIPDRFTVYFNDEGKRVARTTTLEGKKITNHYMAQSLYDLAMAQKSVPGKFNIDVWVAKKAIEFEFDRLIARWEQEKQPRLKTFTKTGLASKCRQFVAFYGNKDVREIHNTKDFYQSLRGATSTKNVKMVYLGGFFKWLIEDERILLPPGPVFPKLEVIPEREPVTVSRDVQESILLYIEKEHQPIFLYMVYQGCRPCEARALKWECVDLINMMVTYRSCFSLNTFSERTKTGEIIHNPLLPETLAVLPARSFDLDYVFKFNSAPYNYCTLSRAFARGLARFNKATNNSLKITMYEFVKHSFGTQLVNKGLPVEVMQQWWGHADSKMTRKYAKLKIVDYLRREVGKVVPLEKESQGDDR